jgi:glycosyltransferase involved in cell wall biosynthesis
MITGRDILILNDDWGRFPSTLQHIAKVLMKNNNRVFWVGSLGLRKPKLNLSDIKRAFQKAINVFYSESKKFLSAESKPILIFPFVIPFHDLKIIRKINRFFILKEIKEVLLRHKSQNLILLTSSPVSDFLISELNESVSIYYCVDDYTSMHGAFKILAKLENKLIAKADAVFSVSEYLYKSRISRKNNFLVPQGVDSTHFQKTSVLSNEVINLKKPVIGFFGLVSEWIDLELIHKCILNYPDYTFVIIGKSVVDLSIFNGCKNFIFLGPKEYSDLPTFASVFDVGLIPFKINQVTLAANPLKLMEYFSLGLPVVSTNLPEVNNFSDLAFVANSHDEFIKFIKNAIEDYSEERVKLRLNKAKDFSWEFVTEEVFDKVLEIQKKKTLQK